MIAAKLRYLAENVSPEWNLVEAVLSTRVLRPTFDDQTKLQRALEYLNKTNSLVLKIDKSPFDCVHAYIEALCGSHSETLSHSGIVLTVGINLVMFKKTQQIITLCSTIAELLALTAMNQYVL